MMEFRTIWLVFLAAVGVGLAACSGEERGASSGDVPEATSDEHAGQSIATPATSTDSVTPDHSVHEEHTNSSAEPATETRSAWAALNGVRDEIAQVVAQGKLSEVHEKSEHLAPLGEELRKGSADLAAEQILHITGALNQLARVAGDLHVAADANDATATRRALERLDGILKLIRMYYPADALDAVPASHGADGNVDGTHAHGSHAHSTRPLAAVDDDPTATIRILANEFRFVPKSLALRAGEPTRIELANDGQVDHALIVEAPDGKGDWIHLHALAQGTDAGTFRIDEPGTYPVLCTIAGHTEAGMVGQLIVQ